MTDRQRRRTWLLTLLALSALGVLVTVVAMEWREYMALGESRQLLGEWKLLSINNDRDGPQAAKGQGAILTVRWRAFTSPPLYARWLPNGMLQPVRVEERFLIWGDSVDRLLFDGNRLTLDSFKMESNLVFERVQEPQAKQ